MAQRIQLKRSSILGKRPDPEFLEPGEVALNTNAADPGAFFETNDGGVAKMGPTFVGINPPITEIPFGNGENWYDAGNATFNTYSTAVQRWLPTLSPIFGGAPTAIFVGSEFPEATDDLSNDGAARPFATINRACIEVARRSILKNRNDAVFNAKFVIVMLPGDNTVCNEPGLTRDEFAVGVTPFIADQPLPQALLRTFNPPSGGLLLPRGSTIFGFDLRKTIMRPTYYPLWTRELYEQNPAAIADRTAVVKWTGNTYLFQLTFRDKKEAVSVRDISTEQALLGGTLDPNDVAILTSLEPHGYRTLVTDQEGNPTAFDLVTLSYPDGVSRTFQGNRTAPAAQYLASPIDPFRFTLVNPLTGQPLLRNQLPEEPAGGTIPAEFLNLTYANTTHHRLNTLQFATDEELEDYYFKVQSAFANLDFGGTVNNAEVAPGETQIVAPVPPEPTRATDSVKNGSPYVFNCSTRSQLGMNGLFVDGNAVTGLRSALASNETTVSLNNDADVYEVYDNNAWLPLKTAYANSISLPLNEVTNAAALDYLINSVELEDVRYFYRARRDIGTNATNNSSGLPDDKSDTRNFGAKVVNRGYMQVVSSFAVGPAVNYWAQDGGRMSLSNANSNFGGQAIRAEGFRGIGTTGGSEKPDRGFQVLGIRRPLNIDIIQLQDTKNHKEFRLNTEVASTTATTIVLDAPFVASTILPYTLKSGTKIYVKNMADGTLKSATLNEVGGSVVSADGLTINVLSAGNTINGTVVANMTAPYIRRFVDPRTSEQKSYSLWLINSDPDHRPPQAGKILRFAENPPAAAAAFLVPGVQLDPGQSGGWNHVFQAQSTLGKFEGDNPNVNLPGNQASRESDQYYVSLKLCDNAAPWIGDEPDADIGANDPDLRRYAQGQFATYQNRVFEAGVNEFAAPTTIPPTQGSWLEVKPYEVTEPIPLAYGAQTSATYPSTVDPLYGDYAATDTYARGVAVNRGLYDLENPVDEDDGEADLGLNGTGDYAFYGDPAKFDPIWSSTKQAMYRLLRLLGYTDAQADGLLLPQNLGSRNLEVENFPGGSIAGGTGPSGGYAVSTARWPMEFNQPSVVNCSAHQWEWAGYYSYSKGLPEYQEFSLTNAQRLSYLAVNVWGGDSQAYGTTEAGEFFQDNLVNLNTSDRLGQLG